jgi:TRAP-type C4-dicarboxylate transport system permease small subunit
MTRVLAGVRGLSKFLHVIAGVSLVFLTVATCADVVLRFFRHPIPGTYEVVGYAAALAIGFTMPFTSWMRGHVSVDSMIGLLPKGARSVFHVVTRLLAISLFVLLGWNLVRFGLDLRASGESSPTLELRFYPVVFGLALASFVEVAVLLGDLAKIVRGEYE